MGIFKVTCVSPKMLIHIYRLRCYRSICINQIKATGKVYMMLLKLGYETSAMQLIVNCFSMVTFIKAIQGTDITIPKQGHSNGIKKATDNSAHINLF